MEHLANERFAPLTPMTNESQSPEKNNLTRKTTQPYVNDDSGAPHNESLSSTNYNVHTNKMSSRESKRSNGNKMSNTQQSATQLQFPTPLTSELMSNVRLLCRPEDYIPVHEPTAIAASLALKTMSAGKNKNH